MKKNICWIGMLTLLFAFFFTSPFPGEDVMEGYSGLTIKIFLGYCSIILVAQVYSALTAIREMLTDFSNKKRESRGQTLR